MRIVRPRLFDCYRMLCTSRVNLLCDGGIRVVRIRLLMGLLMLIQLLWYNITQMYSKVSVGNETDPLIPLISRVKCKVEVEHKCQERFSDIFNPGKKDDD
jgi:hypothetical protein